MHRFPRLRSPLHALILPALVGVLTGPAAALDTACAKALTQANLKLIDAPAFHQHKRFASTSFELIKADGKLFQRMGTEAWAASPLTQQALQDGARQAERLLLGCERVGTDTLDGMVTEVYRFTVKGAGGEKVDAKVWIGARDGLPYREESAEVKGRTSYRDVKAPR